jgi:hypothetical protein
MAVTRRLAGCLLLVAWRWMRGATFTSRIPTTSASAGYSAVGALADLTPPLVVAEVNGTEGANGWYVSDVEVSWSVTDPESAILSEVGCEPVTVTEDTEGVTFTCTAISSGGTTIGSVTLKRDATAPLVVDHESGQRCGLCAG